MAIRVTAPVRIDISAGWSDANPFQGDFGGAVLNAAIDLRVSATLEDNKLISSLEKVPRNSGLGTSGAIRTVYLVAANPSLVKNKLELIRRVNVFENAIVGQRAGFQDQAAAIFGGVNYWEFHKGGTIHRFQIPKKKAKHLFDRLILVYTGDRRQSSNVHESVFGSRTYIKKIPTFDRMKQIAKEMADDISNEKRMAELIRETWMLQKTLHKSMDSPAMKKIGAACEGSYLAGRATGAGGGGCMIFYMKPSQRKVMISKLHRLQKRMPRMKVLPFKFDYEGIKLSTNNN